MANTDNNSVRKGRSTRNSAIFTIKTTDKLLKIKDRLRSAEDLAFLAEEEIAVADRLGGCVRIYESSGEYRRQLTGIRPYGIATNRSGMIACTHREGRKDCSVRLFGSDGKLFGKWGDDMVWQPRGIAFNNRGQLVVTDINEYRHTVGVYTSDGRVLEKFGNKGAGRLMFNNPWYVAVDLHDRIIVSDHDNHKVKVYNSMGKPLFQFGQRGSDPGDLLYPRGVVTDTAGNIMVADTNNRRVSVFSPDGRFIAQILDKIDGLAHPFGICFSRSGKFAVSQHNSGSASGSNFRKIRVYQVST